MEIELKYFLGDNLAKDRILEDKHLAEMRNPEGDETLQMKAIYFDTAEGDLRAKKIALRARFENDNIIVTLKWKGSAVDGLHVRGELNLPAGEDYLENPTVEVFRGSEIFSELEEAAGGKELIRVMEMDFLRKSIQIDTGSSISVISLDEGIIRTGCGDADILEVEIELYSGEQRDMAALGEELAAKYNLVPCDMSKYQRGLQLLGLE